VQQCFDSESYSTPIRRPYEAHTDRASIDRLFLHGDRDRREICTYSGGLSVLAGDTIRAAADLSVPMVAITLLYRRGYFTQKLEADGWQREALAVWAVEELLEEMPQPTRVMVEGRVVHLRLWRYDVQRIIFQYTPHDSGVCAECLFFLLKQRLPQSFRKKPRCFLNFCCGVDNGTHF
jgi:hypothetical protein